MSMGRKSIRNRIEWARARSRITTRRDGDGGHVGGAGKEHASMVYRSWFEVRGLCEVIIRGTGGGGEGRRRSRCGDSGESAS